MKNPVVLPDRKRRVARPHVPKATPAQGSWIVETGGAGGGGGGGGGTAGAAPPVTIDPVADVIFRNNLVIEVDVTWTPDPTATPRNFSGVAVFLEDPDISTGTQLPLDGSIVLDGSAQVSGEWAPVHVNDSGKSPAVVFPDSAMGGANGRTYTQSRNVRIYLAAYGPGSPPLLVRATDPNPTPNILVEIPIGPGQGQSGMEWAYLVQWDHPRPGTSDPPQTTPSVTVEPDYNRPDPKYSLTFKYNPPDPSAPVPPGVNRFGGVRMVYVHFDAQGNEIFPGIDTGIDIPALQGPAGYKSSLYDAGAGGTFRCYFCSEDDSSPVGMHINSLVDGVTPYADAVVPAPGVPTAPVVTGFTISNQRSQWELDNTFQAQADFAWNLPDASADNRALYAGVRLYLVKVAPDQGNDGSVPLTSFPQPLSDTQANVDTNLTLYETPPALPEIWTIAAISVTTQGALANDPKKFGQPSFTSPTVVWNIGPPKAGSPGSGEEYAPLVTVGTGAQAAAAQSQSSDGVGMVSFQLGPWVNPPDASFGGVQVAMVVNKDPNSAVYWSVPKGNTTFTTPSMPSFGNIGANVPVDFYLVSDDPQGHKNTLITSATGLTGKTPKIASVFVPSAGSIIPARTGWFSSEFSWPANGSFQAVSFAAQKIYVGNQLVVGGAPSSFSGPNGQNGQIAVKKADGTLVAWMGQSEPGLGQGQGPAGVYGGWFGQIYVGGTNPLDAPIYIDANGIIEVGGIAPAQNSSAYPYISIRDSHGLEVGRIGANLNVAAPTGAQGSQGGVGPLPPALTNGAWFTQAAFGGSNLSNWNILITPDPVNPLGSQFQMRNLRIMSIDYAAYQGTGPGDPSNAHYQMLFGSSVWHATDPRTNTSWQFPGIHLFQPDPNNTGQFGATFTSRGLVMKGPAGQNYNVLGSLVMWNGLQSGADTPPFWCELALYGPVAPYGQTVYLTSGGQGTGNASLTLRDKDGNTLFGTDPSGNTYVAGLLQGVQTSGGAQTPIRAFAYSVAGKAVIDSAGNWVGNAIAATGNQTPWIQHISAAGFDLYGAGEIHGTTFWLGGASKSAGAALINSSGTFVGAGGVSVGTQAIYCGFLSTVQTPGSSGEIDCGLVKCNNNVIVTLNQNAPAGQTGWVIAEHIQSRQDLTAASLIVNGQTAINTNGAFVSPGGIDVGPAGIACSYLRVHGRTDSDTVYSIGAFYYGENVRLPNGTVVIDQSRNFSGASLNVGGGNVTCGSANISGNLTCGSFTLQGLISANQIAVQCSPVDAVTATLVGYGQFRAVYGNYGVFWRNDGATMYLLQTASGNPYGSWNNYRSFSVDLNSGNVMLGSDAGGNNHQVNCAGNLVVGTTINAGQGIYATGIIQSQSNVYGAVFIAANTGGLWVNNTSGTGTAILRLWNDNNVYLDNGGVDIYIRPASGRYVFTGNGGSSIFAPNGSVDLGASNYRFGTLYVTNLNVTGSTTGITVTGGVTSLNNYAGAVTLYQGTGMSVTGYGNGLMFSTAQDISTNAQPTFYNLTLSNAVKANYIQNNNASATIDGNGNIGCQDIRCNTLTNGGLTCVQNGTWIGNGVQSNHAVFASIFGIYGIAQGWPQYNTPGASGSQSFATGDGRRCYVVGGIIVAVQ